jgi:hypothetical protein
MKHYSLLKFPGESVFDKFKNHFKKKGEYTVAVINSGGCPSISNLGKKMAETIECDFVVFWSLHIPKKEYVLSFRSNKTNVEEIAKLFGGGGHIYAASCSVDASVFNITDLFYVAPKES